jgi:hypothetical protein
VTPAAEREPKVVETVHQGLAFNRHRDVLELGEVRQPLSAWFLRLAEHDLLVRSVQCLPYLDSTLEGTFAAVAELPRVTLLKIFE